MKYKNKNGTYSKLLNIISLVFFCLSYFLYYLSLEKCLLGVDVCGNKVKWILKKILQLSASSIISSLLFLFIISNKISRLHIFHFSVIFFYFYNISHFYYFSDHGMFNFIGFFSLFSFILILGLLFKVFISLINLL